MSDCFCISGLMLNAINISLPKIYQFEFLKGKQNLVGNFLFFF